jgi:hypothetical protein
MKISFAGTELEHNNALMPRPTTNNQTIRAEEMEIELDKNGKPKIGGLLIFVAIGTLISGIGRVWDLIKLISLIDRARDIAVFDLLMFAAASNLILIAGYCCILVLMKIRSPLFPFGFIGLSILILAYSISFAVFSSRTFGTGVTQDTLFPALRIAAYCAIWIPYMLRSGRVKVTFNRQDILNDGTITAKTA